MNKLFSYLTEGWNSYLTTPQKEIIRKLIHSLIFIFAFIASIHMQTAIISLILGILLYIIIETLRINETTIPFISQITEIVHREDEKERFIIAPITLGLGALISLILFPLPVAQLAIFSIAFGDSAASIAGQNIPSSPIPYNKNKTIAGSVACFIMVFICTIRITGNLITAIITAFASSFIESLSTGQLENIILPVGTGCIAYFLLLFT
jgi:phytol kinase